MGDPWNPVYSSQGNTDPWGNPSGASSRRSAAGITGDGLTAVTANLNAISSSVGEMNKILSKQKKDVDRAAIDRLHQLRASTRDTCKQTKDLLMRPVEPHNKQRHEKLTKQFQDLLQQFERAAQSALQYDRQIVDDVQQRRATASAAAGAAVAGAGDFQLQEFGSGDVDAQLLEEANRDMQMINRELQELKEVMVDVAGLVEEQGGQLNTVEGQVNTAYDQVGEGVITLGKSEELACTARKKIVIIAVLVCCIICVIILLLIILICSLGCRPDGFNSLGGGSDDNGGTTTTTTTGGTPTATPSASPTRTPSFTPSPSG